VAAREFDNRSFWNRRYSERPEIGSGPGSRGYVIPYKRRLVAEALRSGAIRSVLDIGCGDLCFHDPSLFAPIRYVGVDISEVVVEKNRQAFPGLEFVVHDVAAAPLAMKADLVLCFDVLIHQLERARFASALVNALACIGATGLFSYKTPPGPDGAVQAAGSGASAEELAMEERFQAMRAGLPAYETGSTAFHGPLPDHVLTVRPDIRVEPVGRYRYQTIYRLTPCASGHP
jgi:SAM-dependent methyltransferase